MDTFEQLLLFASALMSFVAWRSSRGQWKQGRARLEKAEQSLESLQQANALQRRALEELQARLAAGSVAVPTIAVPTVAAPTISAEAIAPPPVAAPIVGAPIDLPPAPAPAPEPPGAQAAPASGPTPPPEGASLEEKIALVWFTRIGALALLVGIAFFFKYAVDNDWVGPLGRVAIGALLGLGLLVAAEAVRATTKPIFIQVLLGVGLAFLFVSAYASHGLYHLVPAPAAFAAISVITLLGGALSVRHRGEGVLILSLLAAFACPILLSTGEDRPGALFGYLFVLTALAFSTSARMGFRYATWLALVGPVALFIGWYAKYFDPSPPLQTTNADGDQTLLPGGVYFPLGARAIPLGAVAAFLCEWLAVQRFARRSPHRAQLMPVALLVTALVVAHAGFSALLYDHAQLLGLVLVALALVSSILLGAEERRELLGIPLTASFLVLLYCAHQSDQSPNGMLAVLGLVGFVYAGGVLRGQLGRARTPDGRTVLLFCGVGIGLALASGVLLLEQSPTAFAVVLGALSLAYAAFAVACGFAAVAAGAAALSFAGLLVAEPAHGQSSPIFLVAAAAWAAIYFATAAYDLLARRAQPALARLFTISGAGLGFAALAWVDSPATSWLLRSTTLLAIGALDLAVGAALAKRRERQAATVLLGQALGLFAGAAAVLFSGATVTVIWAALAAVTAALAAAEEDPQWLAGAGLLFAFTLARAFAVDFSASADARQLFFTSHGTAGALRARFLLNTRALALGGTAAAFLVSARALAQRSSSLFQRAAFLGAACGHALVAVLCICEARDLYLTTPIPAAIPIPLDGSFGAAFYAAVARQAEALSMVTTVVMSLYAALLVGIGFGARSRAHRFLGLGLFALTLLKLVGWDVWHLPRIEQMVVLVAMGALLLGSSFLYARFGKRLVTLLRDGELSKPSAGAAALSLFFAVALASGNARALDPGQFVRSRSIEGISAPGLYRVEVDPPLYAASARELADVRIAGPDGSEVPFVVRDIAAGQQLIRHDATVVDPVALADGSTRAVLDLGAPGLKHSEVELEIDGSDFLRRTRIESSSDEISFATLAEGALVYRVSSGDSGGAGTSVSYPVSDARYLRVTLLPGADKQALRITAAHLAYTTEASRPPRSSLPASIALLSRRADSSSSRFVVDVGQTGLPIDALALEIATPLFERRVSIRESDDQQSWLALGGGLLYRAPGAEGLSLRFAETRARYLRLEIADGDNPPLELRSARASYRPQELVLSAASAGPHTLFVGAPTVAIATYDLGAILARAGDALAIIPARFGPLADNAAYRPPAQPAPPVPPLSERYKSWIVALLGLALFGLALWTLRLLRASAGEAGGPPKQP